MRPWTAFAAAAAAAAIASAAAAAVAAAACALSQQFYTHAMRRQQQFGQQQQLRHKMPMRYANCKLHLNSSWPDATTETHHHGFPSSFGSHPLPRLRSRVKICSSCESTVGLVYFTATASATAGAGAVAAAATVAAAAATSTEDCVIRLPAPGDVFGPFAIARSVVVACCRWSGLLWSGLRCCSAFFCCHTATH